MEKERFDAIVIGAGFAGAVTARELAERAGKNVLVIERRPHVGGNAYDCLDGAGVLIHQYGPHIFHTNDRRVFEYLSRFTQWRDYEHRVLARVNGGYMPVPFNLTSLEYMFGETEGARLGQKLIDTYGAETKVPILKLRETEDEDLKRIADCVYENVFVHYTMKQWGMKPEEIDPATTGRVPVFISRDDRYFQDAYQGIPAEGYTRLFERLLDAPGISLRLGTEAADVLDLREGTVYFEGRPFEGDLVFTGALDELFGCRFGRLPYRTLDMVFETRDTEWYQPCGTVNFTVDEDFTRITEFKYFSGQQLPVTTIMKEYSKAYTGAEGETPYYAVINDENGALYARYAGLAAQYPKMHLLGRLAEYRYYNMDVIAGRALDLAEEIIARG